MSNPPTRRLGSVLVDAKVLSEQALEAALERQQETGKRLGAVLVDMGLLDEQTIVAALGIQFDMPVADCHQRPDRRAVALLPEPVARRVRAAPLRRTPAGLEVAVADALDSSELARLEEAVGAHVVARLARDEDVRQLIDLAYPEAASEPAAREPASPRPDSPAGAAPGAPSSAAPELSPTDEDSYEVLRAVVAGAVRAGASDVHIVPDPIGARALYRVDGILRDGAPFPASARAAMARGARRLAGPSRRGRPTHGAFSVAVEGRTVRVLASSCPTLQGERLRLRIVADTGNAIRGLDQLGMPDDMVRSFTAILRRESGLVVIAGPRRSGRTTTAYAAAAEMGARERSVIMVERAAAHVLPFVDQVETGAEPTGRALLEAAEDQDVDGVVIDDLEGAGVTRATVRLAQRGVLVVMTVTAVDARATLAPFLDVGIPEPSLEGALCGVLRQRLDAAPAGGRVAVFDLSALG